MSTQVRVSDGHFSVALPVRVQVVAMKVSAKNDSTEIAWRLNPAAKELASFREPPLELLTDFCRFRQSTVGPARIAQFAERWGVLGQRVRRHYLGQRAVRTERATNGVEPVWLWREVANSTRALAALAVAVSRNEPGEPGSWELACSGTGWENSVVGDMRQRQRRQLLTSILEERLRLANVTVTVDVEPPDPVVAAVGFGPLGGALALVALGIGSHTGLGVCSHPDCGEPFIARRRPDPLKATFCHDHRKTGPTLLHKHRVRGTPRHLRGELKNG